MTWLHTLWFNYFWPSLQGNGPEALMQTVVYGAAGFLLGVSSRRLHAKLDHIIKHHPDIPDFKARSADSGGGQSDATPHGSQATPPPAPPAP